MAMPSAPSRAGPVGDGVRAVKWRGDTVVAEPKHHSLMCVGQVVAMVHPDPGIRGLERDLPHLSWADIECVHPERTAG